MKASNKDNNIREILSANPNPKMIEMAEKLLADAKAGEIVGFVGCLMFKDQQVDDTWVESPHWWHTSVSSDRIIGALSRLKFRLLSFRCLERADSVDDAQ